MEKRTAAVHNLGCKVNAYEAEAMQELLENAGYRIVSFEDKADVYIVNTCTVTNIADRKSRQMLHRARSHNPDAIVVAAGCYAQTGQKSLEEDGTVDLILGNDRKQTIVQAIETVLRTREKTEDVIDIAASREYEDLHISRTAEHIRAFIKVTDGCNQFCSYCLIPYARGRVRSRQPSDVLQEIRTLADRGYKEVVLTGIHLSSYGTDLPYRSSLLSLIDSVSGIKEIERIRLGSLEPGIITEDFVSALLCCPSVCPHFHLSLQSGCDETLRRMNRHYTSSEYAEKCSLLRTYFRDPAITTDIIVGFPMETEEEFEASYRFVEEMRFYETHIFKYSRRTGTRAASMPGQIPEEVKNRRSEMLQELNRRRIHEYEAGFIGRPVQVLLEEEKVLNGQRYMTGHTKEYLPAAVRADGKHKTNDLVMIVPSGFPAPHMLA